MGQLVDRGGRPGSLQVRPQPQAGHPDQQPGRQGPQGDGRTEQDGPRVCGRLRDTGAADPRVGAPRRRLGELHDDERHVGLQVLRRELEVVREVDPQPDRHRVEGWDLPVERRPTAEGEIPPPSVERLAAMGRWLKVNGEAIYGTTASPFTTQLTWGRATRKGSKLYLH